MTEQDGRDAAAILSVIEDEFRRALEAEQAFLDWRETHPDARQRKRALRPRASRCEKHAPCYRMRLCWRLVR
jgi:hypothetical protein